MPVMWEYYLAVSYCRLALHFHLYLRTQETHNRKYITLYLASARVLPVVGPTLRFPLIILHILRIHIWMSCSTYNYSTLLVVL